MRASDRPGRRSRPFDPDAPAVAELAAGAVLVRPRDGRLLLLHEASEDRWCFPKGHVDPGESVLGAARRELLEETGIPSAKFGPELAAVHYRFYQPRKRRNSVKTTIYFVAYAPGTRIRTEPIFDRFRWVTRQEASRLLPRSSERSVLRALGKYVSEKGRGSRVRERGEKGLGRRAGARRGARRT